MRYNYPQYDFSYPLTAYNGWATWSNLVKLSGLAAADQIIFDNSNNDTTDAPSYEAYIRKAWAAGARVAAIVIPSFTSLGNEQISTPSNATEMTQQKAILDAYGVPYVDVLALFAALVPGTNDLTDLMADSYHLTAAGHQIVYNALAPYLPSGGKAQPSPLPAYVNAGAADFEQTPVVIPGTDYDSRTGTWADDGTSTSSSEAGATITYSGTFRSFGSYRADAGTNTIEVAIDGGEFAAIALYQGGYDIGTRAAHTIVIRIPAGGGSCRIDEFWAI